MPAPPGSNPANHTCFTCSYFRGLVGVKANCGHHRKPPVHDRPELGCTRWAWAAEADRDIWTCEDWHVAAGRDIPGYVEAPLNLYRPPLSGAEVRDIYETPCHTWKEARQALRLLAWEIGRERDFKVRIRDCLLALAAQPKTPMQTRVYLRRLAQRVMEDPGIREEIERQLLRDQAYHRDSDT